VKKRIESLFLEHYGKLCRIANKILYSESASEDVVMKVFLNLLEKPHLLNDISTGEEKGYLIKAVKNEAINERKRCAKNISLEESFMTDSQIHSFETATIEQLWIENIFEMVRKHNAKYYMICHLKYNFKLNYQEISNILDIKPECAKSLSYRARQYIVSILKNNN